MSIQKIGISSHPYNTVVISDFVYFLELVKWYLIVVWFMLWSRVSSISIVSMGCPLWSMCLFSLLVFCSICLCFLFKKYFYFVFFIFTSCLRGFCWYVCGSCVCLVLAEALYPLGLKLQTVCCESWEFNYGLLEKQPVFLNAVLSLQPCIYSILNKWITQII